MMMTQTLSQATNEKAERLIEMIPTLSKGHDRATGIRFVIFPSSDDPTRTGHRATALGCSCDGFKRRAICSHQAAMARARDRAQNELVALAQRCRVADCGNMRESRTGRCAEHFATLVDELGI
jgi:hypothetical protein